MDLSLKKLLPGTLGDEKRVVRTDPRLDPRMKVSMNAAHEMMAKSNAPPPFIPVKPNATEEELYAMWAGMEKVLLKGLESEMDGAKNVMGPYEVEESEVKTQGVDGNEIALIIFKPKGNGPFPGVLNLHGVRFLKEIRLLRSLLTSVTLSPNRFALEKTILSFSPRHTQGGMAIFSVRHPGMMLGNKVMASYGLVVVAVEFRNAAGKLGNHPFPAGLNDCSSALDYVSKNKETLSISKLVVAGPSGGGNLSLALAMKMLKEGRTNEIDGVYAFCPYIGGPAAYADPVKAGLLSLVELNDEFWAEFGSLATAATVYDPSRTHEKNPLAWPFWAEKKDLEGLPPHVISVNELDVFRDEGLAYHRKLLEAGVSSVGRIVVGSTHASDLGSFKTTPDMVKATLRDLKSFADSL